MVVSRKWFNRHVRRRSIMKTLTGSGMAFTFLCWGATSALAQVPAVPGVPGGAPAAVAPVAPVAPVAAPVAAPTNNLWSFLCPTPEQKAACKAKICNSGLGQLLNNSLKPASTLTGGVVPTLCPTVNPADLLAAPDSAVGAAAQI